MGVLSVNGCLSGGLDAIIKEAKKKKGEAKKASVHIQGKIDFYESVIISCKAVIKYSRRYARLAAKDALKYPNDSAQRKEMKEIVAICRRVPEFPPHNFREAFQAIYTFHTALHASMNFISLGRLDQALHKRGLEMCLSPLRDFQQTDCRQVP